MVSPFRILLLVLSGIMACLGSSGASAQAGLVGRPLDVCVAPVAEGDTVRRLFRGDRKLACVADQDAQSPGDYWALSAPLPAPVGEPRVRVMSLWQEGLTLHALYADGAIATIATTSGTLGRKIQAGAIAEFVPPARAAPVTRLLWRVDGSAVRRGVLAGQRIATEAESVRSNLIMTAIYAAFFGLGFALLVYNLALWVTLRHRFQLVYCMMVVVLLGYGFSSSGLLAWAAPVLDNNDRMRINSVLLGLAAAAGIGFARCFFEPKVFAGWLGRVLPWVTGLLAFSGFVFAVGSHIDPHVADLASSVLLLPGLFIVTVVLWNALRRGSRYLWLFAIAWAVPIIAAGARVLNALNVFPANFWLDNSTVLSLAFEALVSSLAIAYRVQMLGRERDEALAGELRARKLADADPLTGLLNRRAFLDRFIGSDGIWTLHLIDIDHFKLVNETLGHDGGDEVLRVFARTLRGAGANGMVARLGGEEFAVATPVGERFGADDLLDLLRAARMPFDLRVTASVGSCSGAVPTEAAWKALYRNADRALFEAKTAGRDRSRTAPPLAIAA